jgi:hypothetical protein
MRPVLDETVVSVQRFDEKGGDNGGVVTIFVDEKKITPALKDQGRFTLNVTDGSHYIFAKCPEGDESKAIKFTAQGKMVQFMTSYTDNLFGDACKLWRLDKEPVPQTIIVQAPAPQPATVPAPVSKPVENASIAILETVNFNSDGLALPELQYLTGELRRQALNALPVSKYTVLTTENIRASLPQGVSENALFQEGDLVQMGRRVCANFATQGHIDRFDGNLTLSLELYESGTGKLVGSIAFEGKTASDLVAAVRKDSWSLFEKARQFESSFVCKAEAEKPQAQAPAATQKPTAQAQDSLKSDVPKKETPQKGMGAGFWIGTGIATLAIFFLLIS